MNDLSTVIIESERLILRTWTPEDRSVLERISDESRIVRWLAGPELTEHALVASALNVAMEAAA